MLPASEITASPAVFVLDFYRKPPVFMLLPDIFCPERRYSYLYRTLFGVKTTC